MSKKFLFLISFVLVLSLTYTSYGADPKMIKLDFNNTTNNGDAETEPGELVDPVNNPLWQRFILADSGKEVNGVIVDLAGNLSSARRPGPTYEPVDSNHEELYKDFIFGITSTSGITITLWGLGADRDCNITMYVYDTGVTDGNRIADWNANDACLFTTNFRGGATRWPFSKSHPGDYAWTEANKADYLGRIILKSWPDPCTRANQPYAYVNALVVVPKGNFVETTFAHRPVPFDGAQNAPIDGVLKWRKGNGVVKHELYFGTDEPNVANATPTNHPHLLFYKHLDATNDGNHYDPCGPLGFLKLDKTYYWRVDENSPSDVCTGEVWSFKTLPNFVVEDFDSYDGQDALRGVWMDYHENQSGAEVLWQAGADDAKLVRDGNSLRYIYWNDADPYYSEAYADIATLGIDSNWSDIGAKSLSLWFYGLTTNPVSEQMYVTLTDGDGNSATVEYTGDVNALRDVTWHEWNIALSEFVDDNDVDLSDVSRITIGFGDKTGPGTAGTMYFEDIQLHTTRCALTRRTADFVKLDYAPSGSPPGDCVIDHRDIDVMASDWLDEDSIIPTHNPGDANLVLYYPLNEGDGNKVYPAAGSGGRAGSLAPWNGTMYNSSLTPPGNAGTSWATPGAPGIGGSACLYFNGDYGTRVQCGTYGQAALGIGDNPGDINAITVSAWVKSLGPRTWDPYLLSKFMGILGKRGGWDEQSVIWMFSVTPDAAAFCFTSYQGGLYSAAVLSPFFGQWVHLAATFPNPSGNPNDANSFARIYLNGGQVNSGLFDFSHGIDANIMLSIGCTMDQNAWGGNCPESFYGYIDEVRIYDRALEPNEIAYLADPTPEDGYLQIPVPSAAEVYNKEPVGQQLVNFKDFALVANKWLEEDMYP
jgi:hypothetical protein